MREVPGSAHFHKVPSSQQWEEMAAKESTPVSAFTSPVGGETPQTGPPLATSLTVTASDGQTDRKLTGPSFASSKVAPLMDPLGGRMSPPEQESRTPAASLDASKDAAVRRPCSVSHDTGRRPSAVPSLTSSSPETSESVTAAPVMMLRRANSCGEMVSGALSRNDTNDSRPKAKRRSSVSNLLQIDLGDGEPEHIHQSIHDLPPDHQKSLLIVVEEFQIQKAFKSKSSHLMFACSTSILLVIFQMEIFFTQEKHIENGITKDREFLNGLASGLSYTQMVVSLSLGILIAQYHHLEILRNRLKNPLKASLDFRDLELDYILTCSSEAILLALYMPAAFNDFCPFKYNCLVIFKVFPCAVRYLRDHSPFFGAGGRLAGALSEVRVDGMYVIRLVMSQRPIASVLQALGFWVLITAYCLWVLERPTDPDGVDPDILLKTPSTFGRALWCTIITLTTVGYGDIVPQSAVGGVMMIIGTLFGLILTAVVIHVVSGKLEAGEHQGRVLAFINERQTHEQERRLAALCVQLFFRYVCHKRREDRILKSFIKEAPRLREKRGSINMEGSAPLAMKGDTSNVPQTEGNNCIPTPLIADFKRPSLAQNVLGKIGLAAQKVAKRNHHATDAGSVLFSGKKFILPSKTLMNKLNMKLHQFRKKRRELKHASQFGSHKQTDFKAQLGLQKNLLKDLMLFEAEKDDQTVDRFDELEEKMDALQDGMFAMTEKLNAILIQNQGQGL